MFLETTKISTMIKDGTCLRDNIPAYVLERVKKYLESDMVSLSFVHITKNSIEDDPLSKDDRN